MPETIITNPESLYNFKVEFSTTNLANGETFVEPHTATLDNGNFQKIVFGNKIIIPLTSSTAQGTYALKFHLPQPGSSKFYVTFCQRTGIANAVSSWRDYTSGITTAYRTALRNFVLSASGQQITSTNPIVVTFDFVLTFYGINTNVVSAAKEFRVRLRSQFGIVTQPAPIPTTR